MNRRRFCSGGLAALAAAPVLTQAAAQDAAPRVKGLPGWHIQNGKAESWRAEGSTISCVAPGGGYLTTDREYADFIISLEYRIPPGGNTGVGIRYPPGGHPSATGTEIQILDDDAPMYKNLNPAQYNASIYMHVPPMRRAAKPPGEWNQLVIRCQGTRIEVRLNGVTVQNVNTEDYPKAPPEKIALAKLPRRGCIGLQSHGDPVEFRNVSITEL
jgi:hypothetical protein